MTESGDFLVVWASDGQDGSGEGIFGQHFDANGAKVGPEFQVNTYTTGNQSGPHIAANARGDFVVVWTSHQHESSGYGSLGYDVIGRRLDSSGIRLGDEFPLSPWTGEDRESPSVAVERDGSFLTAWEGKASGALGVFAQRFDRTAQRVGDPFALNTYTTSFQTSPAVATDGRGFVASWSSYDQDGSRFAVIGRRQDFALRGARRGCERGQRHVLRWERRARTGRNRSRPADMDQQWRRFRRSDRQHPAPSASSALLAWSRSIDRPTTARCLRTRSRDATI